MIIDIECKCGQDACYMGPGEVLPPKYVAHLESLGWRKIDDKWECPQCCGTLGQTLKTLRRIVKDDDAG